MAQRAYPLTIESAGQWSPVGASALAALADESDSTYIVTDQTSNVTRIALAPIADPGTDVGFALKGRVRTPSGSGGMVLRLVQGASTEIARRWHPVLSPTLWTDFSLDIEPAEAALITDFADLHIEITSGMPGYVNAISFLDQPGKHPAFSHSRATAGALCQQFDGSFYQPQIAEIGSHGMRRVRNQRKASLTADVGSTANASVTGDDVTLSSADASYYYLQPESNPTFAAGTKVFVRAKIACAAGTRTIGFRVSESGGPAQQSTITVGTTVAEFWIALTLSASGTVQFGIDNRVTQNPGVNTAGGTFTITEPFFQIARPGQTIPDPEYVSLGANKNLLAYSSKFLDPSWTKTANYTVTTTGNVGPNGGAAARLVYDGGGSATSSFQSFFTTTAGAGKQYVVSGYVRAWSGTQEFRLKNTHAGVLDNFSSGLSVGTSWQRFSFTVTNGGSSGVGQYGGIVPTAANAAFDIEIAEFQLEIGAAATDYEEADGYHGWGVDGVRCFATDEYGNDLTVGLGPELVTNGRFDTDSGWTKEGGWSITGGVAVRVPNASTSVLSQSVALRAGAVYQCRKSVPDIAAGSVRFRFAGGTAVYGEIRTTAGDYAESITAGSGNNKVELYAPNTGDFIADNVSVREVYPVRAAGAVRRPAITTRATQNQDAAQWTERGSATIDNATDGTVPGNYLQLRGLGAGGVNDVYRNLTGFSASQAIGPALLVRPVDATGTLVVENSQSGALGLWEIDISALAPGRWTLVNRSHAAVTVTNEFAANGSGSAGLLFHGDGGDLDVDVAVPTLAAGMLDCPAVIPAAASAVALAADVLAFDPTAVGCDPDGGVYLVGHTAFLPATYATNDQHLIYGRVGTDNNNRFMLYNQSTRLGVYVVTNSVEVFQGNDVDARWAVNERQIAGLRIELNNGAFFEGGEIHATDASMVAPAEITALQLGGILGAGSYAGAFDSFYYFAPGTLTDAQCLALSAGDLPAIPELA